MIEGGSSRDFAKVKRWAYGHPESFGLLIDLLIEAVVDHLAYQVEAGADGVQLFDSWAGVLPEEQLFHWSLDPMLRIAKGLREEAVAIEAEDHLMDRGWTDAEMPLHVGFGPLAD
jgi:uroporphyrinogen decarboxylase